MSALVAFTCPLDRMSPACFADALVTRTTCSVRSVTSKRADPLQDMPVAHELARVKKVRFVCFACLVPFLPCQVMASLVDSSAEFWSRSVQLLSEDPAQKLYDHDIRSFETLAFAVAPDRVSDSKLSALITNVFGENASVGEQAAVRRLAFEGLTFSLQDLKARSDGGDASSSRPLPLREREDRKKKSVVDFCRFGSFPSLRSII